ncbi:hypothetical protein NXV35_21475 [Bacteroides faecis]|jgi:hypothetical protein|nr:hypothetical protein [Bacteroides faecis]
MYVDNDHRGYLTINDIHPEDAKRLQEIIQQADKQLLSHSIEVLEKQLHSQLKEVIFPLKNNKP